LRDSDLLIQQRDVFAGNRNEEPHSSYEEARHTARSH
jgi:hypothetical protein